MSKKGKPIRNGDLSALGQKETAPLRVVMVGLGDIRPYGGNPRKNEKAVKPVAESIGEFGFQSPVLLDRDGTILAGHTRYAAAKALGMEAVPAVYLGDLTPVEARAYRLADNKAGSGATWNVEKLRAELKALGGRFKMERFGFGDKELKALQDEFRVDSMSERSLGDAKASGRCSPGDVWRLGNHILVCGDGGDPVTNTEALGGEFAAACVTRPSFEDRAATERVMRQALVHTEGAVYFHLKPAFLSWAKPAWEAAGGTCSTFIINVRGEEPGPVCPHSFSAWIYGWNRLKAHYFCGERNKADVWDFADSERGTQYLLFAGEAMANSTVPEDVVFDPCAGEGDTLVAAEMACRKAVCVENSPEACDRIIARWEAFTHREATRDG